MYRHSSLGLLVLALILGAPLWAQSLTNFSCLVPLPAGGTTSVGFVVPGPANTSLLLRAVGGASLHQFGVVNPVAAPDMVIFNAKGQSFVFATTGLGPNFPALYTSVGAFPLTTGAYYATCGPFVPGSYSVQISDDAGLGGTVLFEVYVVASSNPALGGALPPIVPGNTGTVPVVTPIITTGVTP